MLTHTAHGNSPAELGPGAATHDDAPSSATRPSEPEPVFTDMAIARLFRPWEPLPGVLLAVSGGPDSIAMMLLASAWSRRRSSTPWLQVATVDHRLRPESAQEAAAVASWAKSRGLAHTTLVWEGAKPQSRIQELARETRYGLLLAHARRIGAPAIATAHHADDQAETILFRLLRGSGLAGLAGIASASERGGCLISRPLLDCTKEELVAHCDAEAHPYFRDPSNTNPAFARTQIRDLAAKLAQEGLDRGVLLKLGRRAATAEAALAEHARRICVALDAQRAPARLVVGARVLADEPDAIVMRVIANEIKKMNEGRDIRLDRLERFTAKFCGALRAGARLSTSLAGAVVELDADGTLTLRREAERRRGAGVRTAQRRVVSRAGKQEVPWQP